MSKAIITFPILGDGFRLDFPSSFTVLGLNIHWYGVIIACGFLLAVFYAVKRSKDFGLSEETVLDMVIWIAPFAIICARAYYVIFNFDIYRDNLNDMFKIWKGGLAIYGGVIGAVIGGFVFSKIKKVKLGNMLDVAGLGLLIGQSIGRWGNFVNREAFGRETDIFCRMGLTFNGETIYVHPTFLYESVWNAIGFILLHIYSKKRVNAYSGEIFTLYVLWYGLGRAFIEGLRTDSLYLFGLQIFGYGIRTSQLLAVLSCVGAASLFLYNKSKIKNYSKNQKENIDEIQN